MILKYAKIIVQLYIIYAKFALHFAGNLLRWALFQIEWNGLSYG